MHRQLSAHDLIKEQRRRGGKFVLELSVKTSHLSNAAIARLVDDSSVHRFRVCKDTEWLTNDKVMAATLSKE